MDKRHAIAVPEGHRQQQIRCAIYTRKSTEEGLEQEFNTLHAQREAAEAYILSQKHLGWTIVDAHYDDGGFSGGNLERPALQKLLEDVEAHRIDCVMVYKVDRLSRSLLDFARLMDRFERHSVSFVSVTQQFNTTTSLGRLTLNILLSFAQFEREIISERTRDKMGAARRKGRWVGGTPLLGYDVDPAGGRLIVNQTEAARICEIFELFRLHGSLALVVAELKHLGWTTKSWTSRRGIAHQGRPFTKSSLRLLLTNPTYAGKVRYRGVVYEGQHPAIVESRICEEVQAHFQKPAKQRKESNGTHNAPLAGILFCKSCQQPMRATYSDKGGRRYRYYVCQTAREKGWKTCATKSVSAGLLEVSILNELRRRFPSAMPSDSSVIPQLASRINFDGPAGAVRIELHRGDSNSSQDETMGIDKAEPESIEYTIPARCGRSLPSFRLQPAAAALTRPPRLARLVALAHKFEELVQSNQVQDFRELARLAQVSPARIGQIVILAQLAPSIQEQILFLSTEQAVGISERDVRAIAREPRWDLQRSRFAKLFPLFEVPS